MLKRFGFLRFWTACFVMAVSLGISACGLPHPCPSTPLEEAASYDWLLTDRHYSEPLNTWVKNEKLESFLRKSFRSGGIESLKSQYGFECVSRPMTPACHDCFSCRMSLPKKAAEPEDVNRVCRKVGEMLVEVDIGPGPSNFNVMTYWKRPELGPNAGKF